MRLAPITLIYGPNSSGKSSILRALRLLGQVSQNEPGLPLNGKHIEMGTYRAAVFNGDEKRNFTLAVETSEVDNRRSVSIWRPFFERRMLREGGRTRFARSEYVLQSSKIRFEFELDAPGDGIPLSIRVTHDLTFGDRGSSGTKVEELSLELVFSRISEEGTGFRISEFSGLGRLMVWVPNIRVPRSPQNPDEPNPPPPTDEEWQSILEDKVFELRRGLIPTEIERESLRGRVVRQARVVDEDFEEDLNEITLTGFERYLEILRRASPSISLTHVGPLRSISNTFQSLEQSAGLRADASNLVSFLARLSADAMGQLSDWLSKLTYGRYTMVLTNAEIGGALEDEEGWRDTGAMLFQVGLKDHHTKTYVSPQNAGVGLSQILPILGSMAKQVQDQESGFRTPNRPSQASSENILLIEQPELHLHPRMQADFAEVLVDAHKSFSSSLGRREAPQIVIETHSEALMLRLQKLIRKGRIGPSDLSVLFVDQFAGGGNLAQELRLDNDGNFKDTWPTSFGDVRWSEQLDD